MSKATGDVLPWKPNARAADLIRDIRISSRPDCRSRLILIVAEPEPRAASAGKSTRNGNHVVARVALLLEYVHIRLLLAVR